MNTDPKKQYLGGTPITREQALEGLGDPVTWPEQSKEVYKAFREAPKPEPKRLRTSHIPHEVSARAMLSKRITGKSRRLFMRARDLVVDVPRQEHDEQATYCRSLKRLTLVQLGRRQTQIKRRLRAIAKFLEEHTLESFRKPALDQMQLLEYRQGWLTQEIESRGKQ